jgi:imidazolonepropionase-like amidohydrolase
MPHMDTNTFRRFLLASSLFIAAPLPLFVAMGFASGDWSMAGLGLAFTAGLCILYWWPLGGFLAAYKGRIFLRWLLGYLISLPFYFVTLAALYPLFGGTFRPFSRGHLIVYLSATPQFYALVRLLHYLSRRLPRGIIAAAGVTFSAGLIAPIVLMTTGQRTWPGGAEKIAIVDSRIVDVDAGSLVDAQAIYIKDGRIVEIGSPTLHPDWPRMSAHGQYVFPGLIDVHVHLQSPVEMPSGFQPGFFLKSMLRDYDPQRQAYLASGITSIRDLGGAAAKGFAMRAEIAQHKVLGPRLFFVGRLVTSPHGHPVSTIWEASLAKEGAILASDENTLIRGLKDNLAQGPDAIKFIHGTIGRAKEELSAELLSKGIAWTTQHNLISIVHAETPEEFEDAIRAGATGVEHSAYLRSVPQELAELVTDHRPFIDPTFGEYEMNLTMNKYSEDARARELQGSYESLHQLHKAGARLVVGTDAPMVRYGSGLHDELAHFVRAGFTSREVLQFATINNAAYLGKEAELGRVAAGYRADLILTRENPLEQLNTLRQPVWTMLDGQIVWNSTK